MTAIYNTNEEPMVLSKSITDLFLKQHNPSDLMALYQFYYYTAKWQKTNQPKATIQYVVDGLKWGEHRARAAKKQLIKLGLIEDIQTRNEANRITGHFILVKFIWGKATLTNFQPLAHSKVNALSANSKILYKYNNSSFPDGKTGETDFLNSTGIYIKNNLPIKGKRTKHHRINPLITYWNNLPNVKKHLCPASKIYKQCSRMIRQLKQGTLSKNLFDERWIKNNIEYPPLDSRCYSDKEIKQGFSNLALMYIPGYWPQDKSWVKKLSLATLIYNPWAQNSWFLAYAINPPKLLSKQLLDFQQGKDPMPDVTKKFSDYFGSEDSDMVQLLKKINELVKFYKSLPKKVFEYGDFADFCPTEKKFCLHYLNHLKQNGYFAMTHKAIEIYLDKHWDENSNALRKKLSTFLK